MANLFGRAMDTEEYARCRYTNMEYQSHHLCL